jgi:integrase
VKPTDMAPPRGLTPKFIESLRPAEKAYEVPDRAALGLRLRVLPSGKKVFRWEVSALALVITLGPWSLNVTPGHVTLQEARQWLERLKAARTAGREQLEEVVRELHSQLNPPKIELGSDSRRVENTVRRVAEEFYRIRIKDIRKSHEQVLRVLTKDIVPGLGPEMDIKAVTPRHCGSVIEAVLARGAPGQAGLVLDVQKQFLRWATATGRIDRNPAELITRDTYGLEKSHRDRNLSDEEIVLVWSTFADDQRTRKCALALQLILLTGVRENEMCRAERRYVHCDDATWTIPVRHQKKSRKQEKSAKDFVIPLPALGSELMGELLERADNSPFVVPGAAPSQHYKGFDLRGYLQRRFGSRSIPGRIALPGGPITVHDLRRTMRTKLGELGVSPDIAERCLNHTRRDAYDKGDYLPQRRDALEKWANYIEQLIANADQKRAA